MSNSTLHSSTSVSIVELRQHFAQLLGALRSLDLPGNLLQSIVERGMQIRCVECAIPLSSDDLIGLVALESAVGPSPEKLARLRQGFCARNGCLSRFYDVRLLRVEGVDWDQVVVRMTEIDSGALPVELPTEPALEHRPMDRVRAGKIALAVGLVLLVVAARQWLIGGRIPFLREPAEFGTGRISGLDESCHDPKCPKCAAAARKGGKAPAAEKSATGLPLEIPAAE